MVHLNDRLPENKNILVTNLRSNECKVSQNNKWVVKPVDEVFDTLRENAHCYLDPVIRNRTVSLPEKKMEKNAEYIEKLVSDDKYIKEQKGKVIYHLYNNKDKIKK